MVCSHLPPYNALIEQTYRIFDQLVEGYQLIGFDWCYRYTNAAAARQTQHSPQALLGRTLMERYPGIETTALFVVLQRALHTRTVEQVEHEFILPTGTSTWLELRIQPVPEGILILSLDITARKAAEAAQRAREAHYRLLIDNMADVVSKVNLAGILTSITPSCTLLLGYRPDEVIGVPVSEIVHPDDRLTIPVLIHQAQSKLRPTPLFTQRIRHKLGHYLWVEVSTSIIREPVTGEAVELLLVMRDVTERKYTEIVMDARREEDSEFQAYLKELHEITIELTQIDELDTFYRRVVEAGLVRLGFERFALYLYDVNAGVAQGTYGTDTQGHLVNEAHIHFIPNKHEVLSQALLHTARFHFADNVILYNDKQQIGVGWNAAALLWNNNQPLGWLVADNLLQQKTASKALLDTLGLYGLTVGTLLRQKQIQLALRESEARYRLLTENITDVIIRFNTAGEYLYVSPSSASVLGYTPAELLGQSVLRDIHPNDQALVGEALRRALSSNSQHRNLLIRFCHQQGHYIWLDINGQVIYAEKTGAVEGIIVSARDVSARKAAEAALTESEQNYRLLIENMRGLLVTYNVEGKLTYANDRITSLLGYRRDEVIGSSAYAHSDPATIAIIKAQFDLRQRLLSSAYELTLIHKNGNPVHLLVSASPLVDKQGAYSGSLAVMTDITVQKQAEAALRQALAKEKELGELKSRFVSMASHEFRTPLATILTLTETLSAYRHKFTEAQIELRLERIKEQINHLKGIMEDVLLLSRMQARRIVFTPMPLDLDAFCRGILDEFQTPSESQTRLQYRSSGVPRTVQVDQKLMRQVISNLISNAIKYSPAAQSVLVSLEFTADAFSLRVCDEGIGIPEADLPYIFEPFHRAANVGAISGTGLGMVITKEAVELHGGAITVESQVQQGTTCTVRIPFSS